MMVVSLDVEQPIEPVRGMNGDAVAWIVSPPRITATGYLQLYETPSPGDLFEISGRHVRVESVTLEMNSDGTCRTRIVGMQASVATPAAPGPLPTLKVETPQAVESTATRPQFGKEPRKVLL